MLPENDEIDTSNKDTGQMRHGLRLFRCSICTHYIFFYPISLKEPIDAPAPRYEWLLCKPCHQALLQEIRRSVIRSPVRLRIAIGLVAAERSPNAYTVNSKTREQQEFEREFTWFVWAMILFGLLHVLIFIVLLAIPR